MDTFEQLKQGKNGKHFIQIVKDDDEQFRWRAWNISSQARNYEDATHKPSKLAKVTRNSPNIMEHIMDEGDIFNYFSDPETYEHGHKTMEKAKRSANSFFR